MINLILLEILLLLILKLFFVSLDVFLLIFK